MVESKIPEMVPVRELSVFQTDDGRRLEVFTKTSEVKYVSRPHPEEQSGEEIPQFDPSEKIFVGVAQIGTQFGLKEIKFEIPAKDADEALSKYYEFAEAAAEELHRKIMEARAEREAAESQQIITVPADALDGDKTIIMP